MDKSHADRFEQLFSRYDRELRCFLGRYLTNTSDVDDCIQETYLSIWRQEARGHPRDSPKSYLFITALNVVRASWRKDKSRRQFNHTELPEHCDFAPRAESEKCLHEREAIRLIGNQLDTLRPSTTAVFLMHHIDDLNVGEIAARLEISTRTVERHMARAPNHCRATMGGALKDVLE